MKNIMKLTLLGLAFVSFSASASFDIKSVELVDSTTISGDQVSAITILDSNSSIQSIETSDGIIILNSQIKTILMSRFRGASTQAVKTGGEGSGN